MNKITLTLFTILFSLNALFAQSTSTEFDTSQFRKNLDFANWLIDYEYVTQSGKEKYSTQTDKNDLVWLSYNQNNTWIIVGGQNDNEKFHIQAHLKLDSTYSTFESKDPFDTSMVMALGSALLNAENHFQLIRDTSNLYFNSFVKLNPDKTISVWYLPAFQPSGQAIYGCEWEYIFEKDGKSLLRANSTIAKITGVWIGQPRELWLNYRLLDAPTIGSLYFTLSFRDFFTRIRIDTRKSTSTITRDSNGNYTWNHSVK